MRLCGGAVNLVAAGPAEAFLRRWQGAVLPRRARELQGSDFGFDLDELIGNLERGWGSRSPMPRLHVGPYDRF